MIQYEVVFYLLVASVLSMLRRIISGFKNGCFYLKDSKPQNEYLKTYINNIHFLETPAWYTQFGAVFLFILSIYRLSYPSYNPLVILLELSLTMVFTMSISASANYLYQKGVTGGSSDDKLDEFDGNKTEVALDLGFTKIQFWRKQWFYNKGRKTASILGMYGTGISIVVYLFFKQIFNL